MPYPPPPGPPDVGEFQAIGKLPAPELPDVTGHGGEFLETDGIIPQWEPVSGVLPDQTGHAGEFLTTDGAVASWAPGGGGGGITTVGAVTTPTADAATITGGDTLHVAVADQTNPGALSIVQQSVGGEKLFHDGAAVSPWDVRNFGAVPNDPTNDFSLAYYACLAAQPDWTNQGPIYPIANTASPTEIYIPPGIYYTSRPLVGAALRGGVLDVYGAGRDQTVIVPGYANASTPSNVQGFSGPVYYAQCCYTAAELVDPTYNRNLPAFAAPLVGGVGQSIVLTATRLTEGPNCSIRLHDAYPWTGWLGNSDILITAFSLQAWVQLDAPITGWLQAQKGIIGSRGPNVWFDRAPNPTADIAWGIYANSDGVNLTLQAYLTTNPAYTGAYQVPPTGTLHTIISSPVSTGTPINIEIDYDGSHFDFFVDGVSQGHVVATGPIVRTPWEGVNIGAQGPEVLEQPGVVFPIEGAVDSVRLSKVARHTGTGSFTPPASKYTWDANTMALYNWDQPMVTVPYGAQTITLPFLIGQVVTTAGGPLPHYIRLTGPRVSPDVKLYDFAICGNNSCSGIVSAFAWRNKYSRLWVTETTHFGIAILTSVSFYSSLEDISVFNCYGTGIQYFGDLNRYDSQNCGIGVGIYDGRLSVMNSQPAYTSYAGLVLWDAFFPSEISQVSLDDEVWHWQRQIGAAVIVNANIVCFHDNYWGTNGGVSPPARYFNIPAQSRISHINDTFSADKYLDIPCSAVTWSGNGVPLGKILLENCTVDDFRVPRLPFSNYDGWVAVRNASQSANQTGLSFGDLQANNLAGEFGVDGDATFGGPRFTTPEPDGNYEVLITPLTTLGGGPPAAGSNRVTNVVTTANGFTAFFEAAPGGILENVYSYMIVRKPPPASYFSYLPSIPSSVANPLNTTDSNIPFGMGVTLVPVGSKCIGWQTVSAQTIAEAGTTVGTGNWWELSVAANNTVLSVGVGSLGVNIIPQVYNGNYLSIFNPGLHNIVLVSDGPGSPLAFFDGYGPIILTGTPGPVGVQQTPIHIGERYDASQPLTTYTLKNLKIDNVFTRCVSGDSAIGPGLQPQSAFFGSATVSGLGSASVLGGFATQVAEARYGTEYYWICSQPYGDILVGTFGAYESLFKPWLGALTAPPLDNFCIYPGTPDIFQSTSAADIFATLTNILEGEKAHATFTPPTSFLVPSDLRPFILSRVPASASAVYVLNGRSFTVAFNTDSNTTVNDFIAQMAADGPTDALFVGVNLPPSNSPFNVLQVFTRLPGSAGRAYVMSTDGGGGSFVYGDMGGGVPGTGLSGNFIGGGDTTCVINGTTFPANFRTDADTTVNDLIARIAADPVIDALVACTLVSGKMFVEAKAAGAAGNLIGATSNQINEPVPQAWDVGTINHLVGGSNAMVGNVANIVFCNCPPIAGGVGVTGPMITQLNALNALINAYVGAGVTIADVYGLLDDPGAPGHMLTAYGNGGQLTDDGHVAVFNLLAPLLPGVGTPPSALSYATNPASYANGAPIAANSPTVTGSVVRWTVSPPLPAGLSISSTTGDITGTPTTPTAAADYTIGATNTAGTITVLVNITIT